LPLVFKTGRAYNNGERIEDYKCQFQQEFYVLVGSIKAFLMGEGMGMFGLYRYTLLKSEPSACITTNGLPYLS
jgi:hypothetical protein